MARIKFYNYATQQWEYADENFGAPPQYPNITVEIVTVGEDSGEPVAVTGLSLDLTSYNAKVGGGFYINPVVQPANATNRSVTWQSSKPAVAAVNDMGYVECIAEGDAVITCTTVDGGFTATCTVSVAADESGGGDSGIKVYFKDSPHELTTGGILKRDGTLFDTADGAYLAIPYVEGIEIATCTNANWSVETYPHYLVLDNGAYTPVAGEATGVTAVTGAAQFVATFTGYGSDAVIYANINKYKVMQGTDANSQLYYYIIPGGES